MSISAKYNMIYQPLVERILQEESLQADPVKATKTRLHKLFGAYIRTGVHKRAEKLLSKGLLEELIDLHVSTKERKNHYSEFYGYVFETVGKPNSVLDLGCGFNPFTLSNYGSSLSSYTAIDIDIRTRDLLNSFFQVKGLPLLAECKDLVNETPNNTADLGLMLKLMPLIESEQTNRGFMLANGLNVKHLVITYPIKSISGKSKNMEHNYSASFENAVDSGLLDNFNFLPKKIIGNELIYIGFRRVHEVFPIA